MSIETHISENYAVRILGRKGGKDSKDIGSDHTATN